MPRAVGAREGGSWGPPLAYEATGLGGGDWEPPNGAASLANANAGGPVASEPPINKPFFSICVYRILHGTYIY